MNSKQFISVSALILGAALLAPVSALANVYATNVRLNNGFDNVTNLAGASVNISYLLNENATRGITVKILNGATTVRTITLPGGTSGTFKGANAVAWDGTNDLAQAAGPGTYTVSVTAATTGYTIWTQLTDDLDPWTYVNVGQGIAVDQNLASPYYGRIFIANAATGPNPGVYPGDRVGIIKLNADGSPAEEGVTNNMGYAWSGGELSPGKVDVSAEDFVYVNDPYTGKNGTVTRWNPLLSTNSLLPVLRSDNIPTGAKLSGAAVTGTGTNARIWLADKRGSGNLGILAWTLSNSGACAPNDTGATVYATPGSPEDVAVDTLGNVYTCYSSATALEQADRVFCFAPYDPSTNGGAPQLTPKWAIGWTNDTFAGASGVAVDPTGTYLAVSCLGIDYLHNGDWTKGSTYILNAANGAIVTNLDLDIAMNGWPTTEHKDADCAWDAVGNVYYVDTWYGVWRAFSPPGTNQSTTVAVPTIQIAAPAGPPQIVQITATNGFVYVDFSGSTSDLASDFTLLRSPDAIGPYFPTAGTVITSVGPKLFRAVTGETPGLFQYYRLQRLPAPTVPAPQFTALSRSAGRVSIRFTGWQNDSGRAFTLMSAAKPNGPYTATAGATVTTTSPGVFEATASASAPAQFYRLNR